MEANDKIKEAATGAGNRCPFLRALVADEAIASKVEPISGVTNAVAKAGGEAFNQRKLRQAISLIALIGNGLSPLQLLRNLREGLHVSELKGGPLDKGTANSRIIERDGSINMAELERLDSFASDVVDKETGKTERGLTKANLETMMDANFERAADNRRHIDRKLMDGEFPVLLRVLGKEGITEPYLSLEELGALYLRQELPQRIIERLKN